MNKIDFLEDRSFYQKRVGNYDYVNSKFFLESPYFYPLMDMFLLKQGLIKKPTWKNGKSFAVCLSHDIDTLGLRNFSEHIHKIKKIGIPSNKRKILASLNCVYKLLKGTRDNKITIAEDIKNFTDIESKYGAKSSFFTFISDVNNLDPIDDCTYSLDDNIYFNDKKEILIDYLKQIKNDGWEIGLHPSVNSYNDINLLQTQKEKLEKALGSEVESIRQHYLMYEPDNTSKIQFESGFKYDSTYGYNRTVGFRALSSYPFMKNGVLEIPLILQDGALFRPKENLGLSYEKALELSKAIIDRVQKVGGVVTLLWHPNVNTSNKELWNKVYYELLDYCSKKDAWISSISEIGSFWNENNNAFDYNLIEFDEIIDEFLIYRKYEN